MNGKCRITGEELIPIHDFGDMYVSDFLDIPSQGTKAPLRLGLGPTSGLLQLYDTFSQDQLYRNYWYMSSINESMKKHLEEITHTAYRYTNLEPKDAVCDVGANDGTLLSSWDTRLYRVGFDPAKNLSIYSKFHADRIIEDFFSVEPLGDIRPKVITSIAMFYDIDDPKQFIKNIKACLHEEGVWICQMSYLPLMLAQNAIDNVCHEHLTYYSLQSFMSLLNGQGLDVIDVEINEINGGSFRLYVKHTEAYIPPIEESIGKFRVTSLLAHEASQASEGFRRYENFISKMNTQMETLRNFIVNTTMQGKKTIGYGASTKGNTLLQYCGLTRELIPYIADRNSAKHGKFTVGTGIPIISEEEMRLMKPDYLLVLPWHFIRGFMKRESNLISQGTRFIVPLPKFEII
jgi:hypothetical protein